MAVYIPFDIQTIIIKKLPVKSLIRFRCVSKQWKSLIESSEFIKNYQTVNDRHLLVRYNVEGYNHHKDEFGSIIDEYVSVIDNDSFPEHMSPIAAPLSVKTLERVRILGSSCGLICFLGYHEDYSEFVFWNPSIRKSVSVQLRPSWVFFGVCPKTRDPKLVKIDDIEGIPEVQVYTLSTRAWKKVSHKPPYKLSGVRYHEEGVCVEGFIYWLARDRLPPLGNVSNYIVSFDLSNDEFGQVYLPSSLLGSQCLRLSKWNECLIMFSDWDVWMMKDDGVTKSLTMMFRIDTNFHVYNVFELRKNGEAIIETRYDDDAVDPILQAYDPCSGRETDIRIPWSGHDDIGKTASFFSVSSYMESLLLLDQ